MRGQGETAAPLWGVVSGEDIDLFRGGWHDVYADATYFKRMIMGLIHTWDGRFEVGMNRPGGDYRRFATWSGSTCDHACLMESSRCRAWTMSGGMCFLKEAVPDWAPLPGAVSGLNPFRGREGELGWDRVGHVFWESRIPSGQKSCIDRCRENELCLSFADFDLGGGDRYCYLQHDAPGPVLTSGALSAVKDGLEMDFDYPGGDFTSFEYHTPMPEVCQARCAADSRCQAWTYRPRTSTILARCWLKSTVPARIASPGRISGRKGFEFY